MLRELLAMRERRIFGRSSEKRKSDEKSSEEGAEEKPRKGHGPTEQPELELVSEEHELPPGEQQCPSCGGSLEPLGDQFEESEEVDVVERRFVLVRHRRRKYRCGCNGCVVTAPGPAKLIPGGRYGTGFTVEVITQKYLDHLPLERQCRIMRREGLVVTSQTLWDQIEAAARSLLPTYDAILQMVLAADVVGADETRWLMLTSRGEERTNKRWWVWNVTSEEASFYRILDSRSTQAAATVLEGFRGIVMADGYGAYDSLSRGSPDLIVVHCWAHVRRKFIETEENFPTESGEMLALIRELYAIDALAPAGREGDALRLELRQTRSRGVVRQILESDLAHPGSSAERAGKGDRLHPWDVGRADPLHR